MVSRCLVGREGEGGTESTVQSVPGKKIPVWFGNTP